MVSATGEKECPLPSTRTRSRPPPAPGPAPTDVGWWNRAEENTTLPAQFRIMRPFWASRDAGARGCAVRGGSVGRTAR